MASSLLPTQTLQAPYIDYVVRGQGEDRCWNSCNHIEKRSAPDFVAGIGFKRDNKLVFTTERPLKPIVDMPPKAYHLADFDAYERCAGGAGQCTYPVWPARSIVPYCTNAGVYGRKWNALPAEQFVEETVDLSRRYGLEMLWIVDDNFLVDLDRARAIAEGLVRAGADFKWSIQATTNLTARLDRGRFEAAARRRTAPDLPGRRIGVSQSLEGHEQRRFRTSESIYESAARCLEAGIRPSFNIIFAFPGEGTKERRETINFMMDVCRRFPGAEFWTNIFTPYPGFPIMEQVEELGIRDAVFI